MYVIETQKVLDLKVDLKASYVIIPQTGYYDATQNIMLLDLGHFKVKYFCIKLLTSFRSIKLTMTLLNKG